MIPKNSELNANPTFAEGTEATVEQGGSPELETSEPMPSTEVDASSSEALSG